LRVLLRYIKVNFWGNGNIIKYQSFDKWPPEVVTPIMSIGEQTCVGTVSSQTSKGPGSGSYRATTRSRGNNGEIDSSLSPQLRPLALYKFSLMGGDLV